MHQDVEIVLILYILNQLHLDALRNVRKYQVTNSKCKIKTQFLPDSNSLELVPSANGTINHTGHRMCHTPEQHILFIST